MPGYAGSTYKISLENSGLNHNRNIDAIPPNSLVYPTRNVTLNEGGIRKRGGTAHVDDYAMVAAATPTFVGDGLDDLSVGDAFSGDSSASFKVEVDGTGISEFASVFATNKAWAAITVNAVTKDAYACSDEVAGTIYFDEDGGGGFVDEAVTGRKYSGIAVNLTGNDAYCCVYGGSIYQWTDAGGTWADLSQTTRNWKDVAIDGYNAHAYATVYGGAIYKRTAGAGDFASHDATVKNWTGIDVNGANGDVYVCALGVDVYKQTAGAGAFVAQSAGALDWRAVAVDPLTGDVYAAVWNGLVYLQSKGTGDFLPITTGAKYWTGLSIDYLTGDVYGCIYNDELYQKETLKAPELKSIGQYGKIWLGVSVDYVTGDLYTVAHLDDIYKKDGNSGKWVATGSSVIDYRDIAVDPVSGTVWLTVYGDDIYTLTEVDGVFVLSATGQTQRNWTGIGINYTTGDVFATVLGGKIYKKASASSTFVEHCADVRNWVCIDANSTTNDVYATVSGGDIYKQTAGAGAFTALSVGNKWWVGIAVDSITSDVWASVEAVEGGASGYIYKQTAGTGSFVDQGQTSRHWLGLSIDDSTGVLYAADGGAGYGTDPIVLFEGDIFWMNPQNETRALSMITRSAYEAFDWRGTAVDSVTGDVWGCIYGGDIYKRTFGERTFTSLGVGSGNWSSMAVNTATKDVFVAKYGTDIYKQTAGTGAFVAQSTGVTNWIGVTVNSTTSDVWACVLGGDIYKQTAGTGSFTAQSAGPQNWWDMAVDETNGHVYATTIDTGIFWLEDGTGSFAAFTTDDPGDGWRGIEVDQVTTNIYAVADGAYVYTAPVGIDRFAIINTTSDRWMAVAIDSVDLTLYTAAVDTASVGGGVYEMPLAAPDSFKWSSDGGATWDLASVYMTGREQELVSSLTITFGSTYGHTAEDYWTFSADMKAINGLYDFRLASGTQFIVRATADGSIWKDDTTTIKTGLSSDKFTHFMQSGDMLFACNGADVPQTWDGAAAATTAIANVPTDWTGTNFPQQMVAHGKGNSLRNWAIGCPTTNKNVYASVDGDLDDFTQATVLNFYIETGDGSGLVGGIDFGDRLLLFSKTRSFVLEDTDTNTDNWGYSESQWYGGAASHRLIIRTPNDVIAMMEDGEIYSVTTAQQYGDYKAASLTRPSYMHEYIADYINLTAIDDFHAVYDSKLRAVLFFMVSTGETEVDTCLAYFIDKPPQSAWSTFNNIVYDSGYKAASSAPVLAATGDNQIYTGGYNGWVWNLNTSARNDNDNGYYGGITTPHLSFEDARIHKRYDNLFVVTTEESYNLQVRWAMDGLRQSAIELSSSGTGVKLGTFMLDTDTLADQTISDSLSRLGAIGKRIQVEVYNDTVNEDFLLSQLLIDFIPIGARA